MAGLLNPMEGVNARRQEDSAGLGHGKLDLIHFAQSSTSREALTQGEKRLWPALSLHLVAVLGQCVLEQAGGHVVDLEGRPLAYNAREELLNPWFVAYGDDTVDWLSRLA